MVQKKERNQGSGVLWGGKLERAKKSGGVNLHEGERGVQSQAGNISVYRAVGKSLDLFRCANTQKDPI